MAATLSCPGCSSALTPSDNGAHPCESCHGLWLDSGGLERAGGALPANLRISIPEKRRACARCASPMVIYASKLVEVDVCRSCFGLYLDPGELQILVGAARPAKQKKTAPARLSDDRPEKVFEHPFTCEICQDTYERTERVIGEDVTACRACAKLKGIEPRPEQRREKLKAQGPTAGDALETTWEVLKVVGGVLVFVIDILDEFS